MIEHSNHSYHLVEKRPWPIISSVRAFLLVSGLAQWFRVFNNYLLLVAFIRIFLASGQWWRDITREGTIQGLHTLKVITGLRWGIVLFIVSEVFFFFSFFWAYFHRSLNATVELGGIWPSTGVTPFNPFEIPLLNTAILLASGVTVTWAHHGVIERYDSRAIQGLFLTIILGVYFRVLQWIEYKEATFTIADSVYGCTFFVATGFHGLHVIIGTLFLFICLIRLLIGHYANNHSVGFETRIWYWHFVDVVWLFLYVSIYWWGY